MFLAQTGCHPPPSGKYWIRHCLFLRHYFNHFNKVPKEKTEIESMFFNGVWNDNNHNTVLDCDTIIYFQQQWAKDQSMKQFMINTRARINKEHMRLVALLIFALGITILLHLLLIVVEKGKRCILLHREFVGRK